MHYDGRSLVPYNQYVEEMENDDDEGPTDVERLLATHKQPAAGHLRKTSTASVVLSSSLYVDEYTPTHSFGKMQKVAVPTLDKGESNEDFELRYIDTIAQITQGMNVSARKRQNAAVDILGIRNELVAAYRELNDAVTNFGKKSALLR